MGLTDLVYVVSVAPCNIVLRPFVFPFELFVTVFLPFVGKRMIRLLSYSKFAAPLLDLDRGISRNRSTGSSSAFVGADVDFTVHKGMRIFIHIDCYYC